MNVRELSKAAVVSALMCVISPFTVPVGAVSLSLATFGVYLSAIVLKPFYAGIAVLVYLLAGAFGLPVFSGANGGVGVLLGPTGGFLAGYFLCAAISAGLKKKAGIVASLILGTVVLYISGTVWFCFVTETGIAEAFVLCVLPFLPGDALKIAASCVIGRKINSVYRKYI